MHFERLEGVCVVGGDEDDGRQPLRLGRLQDLEAIQVRHLHVEKHEIGVLGDDRFHRFAPARAFTHNRHV